METGHSMKEEHSVGMGHSMVESLRMEVCRLRKGW